jgi:electron transport complex protein RnfB
MLSVILTATALAATAGLLLGILAQRCRPAREPLVERIHSLLPHTQCGRCTFTGCRPYAEAIAAGTAQINQCPPGGDATMQALAQLLNREPTAVDPKYGPVHATRIVARIDESRCIGCALCIPACPVDAIVGAQKFMHTVRVSQCTGCELCLPVCPVSCIEMHPIQ